MINATDFVFWFFRKFQISVTEKVDSYYYKSLLSFNAGGTIPDLKYLKRSDESQD